MTIKDIVSLFKETFPDLEIESLKKIDNRYVFTIANCPKEEVFGLMASVDPYIAYNTQTKTFEQVIPPQLGGVKFFKAPEIAFE